MNELHLYHIIDLYQSLYLSV